MTTSASTYRPFVKAASTALQVPQHVKYDRHVLRFYGYFKESVTESNLESQRIRKLVICLYLVDNTISIDEVKQFNSGIPQGVFLKRQNIPHVDNRARFVDAYDFRIGEAIEIFKKRIIIYDCDAYTREFFQNAGRP